MNKLKIAGLGLMIAGALLQACNKPVLTEHTGSGEAPQISLKKKKTLLVVLDGVPGTAVEESNLPTINKMLDNSVYSFYGLIDTISNNGTVWADLVTGTRLNKHSVKTESFAAANFAQYPSFLKRMKDNNSQFRAVAFTTLPLLATGVFGPEMEKHQHLADNDLAAKDSTVNRLKTGDADLLLVDLSLAERAGKTWGFSTALPQYRAALQTIDSYIDEMVYTLQHRETYEKEDWLVVVTSTHGGKPDGSYGGNNPQDRNVFSIYYSPNLKKTAIPRPLVNIPYEGNFIRFNVQNGIQQRALTNHPAFNFGTSQSFTVEMRIKTNNAASDDPALITNKDWGSGANRGWLIFKQGNHTRINFATNVSGSRLDFNGPVFTDNKWHMLSVSFNRNGSISVYQDGVAFASSNIANRAGTLDSGLPLVIGEDGRQTYYTRYGLSADTYISDVRIWNTVVPADLINSWQYLEINRSHPLYKNLIGYWKMNEASGNVLKDYSNTSADLTFVGNATRPPIVDILNPSALDARLLTPGLIDHSFRIMTWMGMRVDYEAWGLDGKVWSGN